MVLDKMCNLQGESHLSYKEQARVSSDIKLVGNKSYDSFFFVCLTSLILPSTKLR